MRFYYNINLNKLYSNKYRKISKDEFIKNLIGIKAYRDDIKLDKGHKNYTEIEVTRSNILSVFLRNHNMSDELKTFCNELEFDKKGYVNLNMARNQCWNGMKIPIGYLSPKEALWHGINTYLCGYSETKYCKEKMKSFLRKASSCNKIRDEYFLSLGLIFLDTGLKKNKNLELIKRAKECLEKINIDQKVKDLVLKLEELLSANSPVGKHPPVHGQISELRLV